MEDILQKVDSIRNAINKVNRTFQVNIFFLFCKPKITSRGNVVTLLNW